MARAWAMPTTDWSGSTDGDMDALAYFGGRVIGAVRRAILLSSAGIARLFFVLECWVK
jgi:hypothetical protein